MSTSPVVHRAAVVEKIPADKLATLAYWEKLDSDQQAALSMTVQTLSTELVSQWKSILRAGKLVNELYEMTNPHGAFLRTLRALWGDFFSASSAYRYRNVYLAVRDSLSEQVVDVAVASGINLVSSDPENPFGKYTGLVRKLPAPKPGVRGAQEWVEKFQEAKNAEESRQAGPILVQPKDADEIEKALFLILRNNLRRLPINPKTRGRVVRNLVGYMLRQCNMSGGMFQPAAPPQAWEDIKRGRPRTRDKAA